MTQHPFLDASVHTPRLQLLPATDALLGELSEAVRDGKAAAEPAAYDDPMSLYEPDPDLRVAKWMQGIWRGRGSLSAQSWRMYLVVMVDGTPVGMQDLIGTSFSTFGTVATFSWLASDQRRRGIGHEMRAAVLHLAFEGFAATEAHSEAFADNHGSNKISRDLGYEPNGVEWATRQDEPALLNRWRLTRDNWTNRRRDDIELRNVGPCRELLTRL